VSDPAAPAAPNRSELVERASVAFVALADQGGTIEEEWQYVSDLVDAYLPSIRALGSGPEIVAPAAAMAVEEAISEVGLIHDPHRAIDWLSTLPHVIALALESDVDRAGEGAAGGPEPTAVPNPARAGSPAGDGAEPSDAAEPGEDSPFRILRGER
jgi:hypothetical protein